MTYRVTKKLSGFSTCFRQHRAESHCRYLHGYSLVFVLQFSSDHLDLRNWVIDFGGFKELKKELEFIFDHTTVVAEDDPQLNALKALHDAGVLDIRVFKAVGCEKFAEYVYSTIIRTLDIPPGVNLDFVRCEENEQNSASYGNS